MTSIYFTFEEKTEIKPFRNAFGNDLHKGKDASFKLNSNIKLY